MTEVDVQVADGIAPPATRHLPALLVTLFLLIKVGQFALAGAALHGGVSDAHFATGIPLVAWDSMHYMAIAAHGYPASAEGGPENICFFPVLPLLSRALVPLLGAGLAVLTVANAASVAGLLIFYAWCRRTIGERNGFWACLLMLAYPPGMFLSAAYTEGIFLVTTGAALYFTSCRRPWLAAVAAGVGTASRPTGIMVAVVVVADAIWRAGRGQRLRAIPKFVAMALIAVSGLAAFSGFLALRDGSPLVYFDAQESFAGGHAAGSTQQGVSNAIQRETAATAGASSIAQQGLPATEAWVWHRLTTAGAWNKAFAICGGLVAGLILIPRFPIPRHILALPLLIFLLGFLPNWGVRLNSCARYLVEALPLFAAMGYLLARRGGLVLRSAVVLMGLAIQCLYVWQFTRGEWAG